MTNELQVYFGYPFKMAVTAQCHAIYLATLCILCLSIAAINVTKVIVNITPSDEELIPLVLNLQDDNIVEPVDFYQLTIVNVSDPNVIVGEINTTFIAVNDDDEVVDEGM